MELSILMKVETEQQNTNELTINEKKKKTNYLVLAQEPVVFWRVLRLKLGSSAGGDSLRFFVDFLKPIHRKWKSVIL